MFRLNSFLLTLTLVAATLPLHAQNYSLKRITGSGEILLNPDANSRFLVFTSNHRSGMRIVDSKTQRTTLRNKDVCKGGSLWNAIAIDRSESLLECQRSTNDRDLLRVSGHGVTIVTTSATMAFYGKHILVGGVIYLTAGSDTSRYGICELADSEGYLRCLTKIELLDLHGSLLKSIPQDLQLPADNGVGSLWSVYPQFHEESDEIYLTTHFADSTPQHNNDVPRYFRFDSAKQRWAEISLIPASPEGTDRYDADWLVDDVIFSKPSKSAILDLSETERAYQPDADGGWHPAVYSWDLANKKKIDVQCLLSNLGPVTPASDLVMKTKDTGYFLGSNGSFYLMSSSRKKFQFRNLYCPVVVTSLQGNCPERFTDPAFGGFSYPTESGLAAQGCMIKVEAFKPGGQQFFDYSIVVGGETLPSPAGAALLIEMGKWSDTTQNTFSATFKNGHYHPMEFNSGVQWELR